ncbi:MAG: ribosomal protein S19 family protein [Candidatus Marsarchaeota archaeon]|jgi:small subunit ribosomal protein S19|nr:ribosomal protein S19 family protein [Candidatus Marsarchaeota archaeon]MCL5112560.1 ribosomal protein S19 family protein [Candidatus Marsarchaeota archaeon]
MAEIIEKKEKVAFKGKTSSEAVHVTDEEFKRLVGSHIRRSIERNALEYRNLLEKISKLKGKGAAKPIKTHCREAVILPSWIGMRFEVYNGKQFVPVDIIANMLGHKLGEFAYSTKRVQHSAPGIKATRGSKFLSVK